MPIVTNCLVIKSNRFNPVNGWPNTINYRIKTRIFVIGHGTLKLAELTLIPSLILKIIVLRSRQIVELLQISHARPDS